ncbi:MAG: sigma factor [Alistipes shahii]
METHQPRGGGTAAFRELFDRYYAPLCRFAAYWLRDRTSAEEIVLDTFTHIWQHAGELRISTSVRAYLFRAVRNRALNRLLRQTHRRHPHRGT